MTQQTLAVPAHVLMFWQSFVRLQVEDPTPRFFEAFHFDDNERSADELALLVLSGVKRATAGLVWSFEAAAMPLPKVGDLSVVTVGRKGRDAMRRARVPLAAHFEGFGDRPTFADVLPLARLITDDYLNGTYNRVDIVFSQFVSTLTQKPAMDTLLPIEPSEDTEGIPGNQFIFEPSAQAVLEQLLPRYVATRLFQAVLEAKASEESSRMVAMKNATENAEELIDDLTLSYNKVRQANITREMIEIATGAEAA